MKGVTEENVARASFSCYSQSPRGLEGKGEFVEKSSHDRRLASSEPTAQSSHPPPHTPQFKKKKKSPLCKRELLGVLTLRTARFMGVSQKLRRSGAEGLWGKGPPFSLA